MHVVNMLFSFHCSFRLRIEQPMFTGNCRGRKVLLPARQPPYVCRVWTDCRVLQYALSRRSRMVGQKANLRTQVHAGTKQMMTAQETTLVHALYT